MADEKLEERLVALEAAKSWSPPPLLKGRCDPIGKFSTNGRYVRKVAVPAGDWLNRPSGLPIFSRELCISTPGCRPKVPAREIAIQQTLNSFRHDTNEA
jgi:hypothetical protein